jgi:hypothetical protein
MEHLRENDQLEFFRKPKPPDPRVVKRWGARLEALCTPEGYLIHSTLALKNTKVFYVPEVRNSVKSFLANYLPSFVVKLEGAWQASGFLFPHAHVLLPPVSEVRPFLTALKWSGVEVVQLEYKGRLLPDPFTILPDHGPTNAGEYIFSLPDISALETLVDFRESTINVLKNSPFLARYFSKVTYSGGLKPLIEHNLK